MRYPSPVPTQRADYKSAEVKAIALWSRERWCLAYHHRIERNRVYLTACSVACVLCILFAMRRREGQGGAPHKMIGPSDGGRRRLLYRLYFNADRTCNTKEKKSWIEIRTSRAQPKLFMGGENFPFFSMAVASTFFGIQKDWAFPFWYEIYAKRTKHFFGIWHIIRRWHLAKIWTCKRNWGYPPGSYISPPSLISRRLIFRTCPQRHSTVKIFCWQKGKWEILFTSQSLSIWISFFFFFSFISWVSHISVKCECVTDSSISETLFDFWHSTCHENGTSIQSFDYWSSCPEFPSISNILLILKRWKRRRRWTLSFCFYFNVKRRKTITKEGIDL